MQAALEAEVSEFLDRDRYGLGDRARAGHRNGYESVSVKPTAGEVKSEYYRLRTDQHHTEDLREGLTKPHSVTTLPAPPPSSLGNLREHH